MIACTGPGGNGISAPHAVPGRHLPRRRDIAPPDQAVQVGVVRQAAARVIAAGAEHDCVHPAAGAQRLGRLPRQQPEGLLLLCTTSAAAGFMDNLHDGHRMYIQYRGTFHSN